MSMAIAAQFSKEGSHALQKFLEQENEQEEDDFNVEALRNGRL